MKLRNLFVLALSLLAAMLMATGTEARDDKKKDIKLKLKSNVERGDAPLPATFVVEIDAPKELDQYIYESSSQWIVEANFVLTDKYSMGSSSRPDPSMRQRPTSAYNRALYRSKHLVAKERNRPPRVKFSEETEVERTLEWEFELRRAGTYYIVFELRNGKYRSNQVEIEVRGDTSYDPYLDPY